MFSRLIVALVATVALSGAALAEERAPWTVEELNKVVASTNWIVDGGCSGTLVSKKYRLITTNYHCIEQKITTIEVEKVDAEGIVRKVKKERRIDVPVSQKLYDGHRLIGTTEYQARIVAYAKDKDLALLQMRAKTIPYEVEATILPDGVDLMRGTPVYIVGNPLGADATVNGGILSATNRMFRMPWADFEEVPFLQVSGGVIPGNSGGALYTNTGYLIGIPAASGGAGHIGLAIPIEFVKEFLKDNCFADVYDDEAESHADCVAEKKRKAKAKREAAERAALVASVSPKTEVEEVE